MKQATLSLLAVLLGLPCLAAEPSSTVRILKVLHDVEMNGRKPSTIQIDITPNETGKFKEMTVDATPRPAGEYLTVIWRNASRAPLRHVTVTLFYRQIRADAVQSGTIRMDNVGRSTTTSEFQVVKEAYARGGAITAWKAVIAADGKELDSFRSFLWKEPS